MLTRGFIPILALFIGASSFVTGADSGTVLQRISSQRTLRLLNEAGFPNGKVDEDDDIVIKMGTSTVLLLVGSEKNTVVKFRYTRGEVRLPLSFFNDWNREKKFTKAYADKDNDPTLEMDLDLEGGITEARVLDAIRTFSQALEMFSKAVSAAQERK